MSRFFSEKYTALETYVPGEQPQDMPYTKLNTNESPYPPSPGVLQAAAAEAGRLQLYSDPTCRVLTEAVAAHYGVGADQVLMTNGSDEILNFAFMAFGDADHPFAFPDITYGFYPVFAKLNGIPYREIPLKEDFSIDPDDYCGIGCHVVIANPNAPTGLSLSVTDIRRIAQSNPDHIVIIDEAYVDFGGETCLPLLAECENLLITRTFSKSYSLAGARLGFGIAQEPLIRDLNTSKNSVNPYNVNRMTQAAGAAACASNAYYMDNCRVIAETREYAAEALRTLGFEVLPSRSNFLFARSTAVSGGDLYRELKARGVLVRWFDKDRIRDFTRITVGTRDQMDILLDSVRAILTERGAAL